MLYASSQTTDLVTFTSTEGSASERPYLELTWEDGVVATPTVSGTNAAPAAAAIVWDTSTHAVKADRTPTFTWTYSGSTAATDWRVFLLEDANNDMAGLITYDSRDDPQDFDIANLSFTPSSDLNYGTEIRWMVQPINNGMLGPRSASTNFYLPNNMSEELDATTAYLEIQDGAFIPSLSYPAVTEDTSLDSGNTQTNYGSDASLYVGRSRISTSNANLRSTTLIEIDLQQPSVAFGLRGDRRQFGFERHRRVPKYPRFGLRHGFCMVRILHLGLPCRKHHLMAGHRCVPLVRCRCPVQRCSVGERHGDGEFQHHRPSATRPGEQPVRSQRHPPTRRLQRRCCGARSILEQ